MSVHLRPIKGAVIPRFGVCYIASGGYLFQTAVSAVQARQNVDPSVGVYLVLIGDAGSEEARVFREVCHERGVTFVDGDVSVMDGLHPTYARLFLDHFLPVEVEEILYLDGDTQIVGDIDPLVHAAVPQRGILAARDPMVFIRQVDQRLGDRIDRWWNDSSIPEHLRLDYVNAGVMRISRSVLPSVRASCLEMVRTGRIDTLQFRDQDAINLAMDGNIGTLSMSWNYPGFLLGTQIANLIPPRIIHFMSNPRPWNAPFAPWGAEYYEPYRDFAKRHPSTVPYWSRLAGAQRVRYVIQQFAKRLTEHRQWESVRAAAAVNELHKRDLDL